jgi:hypothetical protein
MVFAVGAIMRFAVKVTSTSFNIHEVGVILMIIAAVGVVVSLVCWRVGEASAARTVVLKPR